MWSGTPIVMGNGAETRILFNLGRRVQRAPLTSAAGRCDWPSYALRCSLCSASILLEPSIHLLLTEPTSQCPALLFCDFSELHVLYDFA